MEIKRKKITEDEILEAEQRLADEVTALCGEYERDFAALGYEINLSLQQRVEDSDRDYEALALDEKKAYPMSYISRAYLAIRRKKTEEELAREEAVIEENKAAIEACDSPEEAEQLQNDETFRVSDDTLKHTVAFTEVMLVRVYKSFWTEWVSICDNSSEVRSDLAEFLRVLQEKAEEA